MKFKIKNAKDFLNYFCKIKKYKNKVFAVPIFVLFFIMSFALFVGISNASFSSGFFGAMGPFGYLAEIILNSKSAQGVVTDALVTTVNNFLGSTLYPLIYYVCLILLNIAALGVMFAAYLVDQFINPNIYNNVFNSTAIVEGWETIRNACNAFFVLILLLIAFATILRVQAYSAKNLLVKFIIAILLINFSAEITKVVIDGGQVMMFEIRTWMGTFGGSNGLGGSAGTLTSIVGHFKEAYGIIPPDLNWGIENVIGIVFAVVFTVILMFVYMILALFLLIRLVVLATLIIISPFAFFSIILPSMSKHMSEWRSKLISYSLFGPVFLFFVYIATRMADDLTSSYVLTVPPGSSLDPLKYIIAYSVPFAVSIVMLLMSLSVATKLGVAGSNALVGGAMGVGKIAIGTYAGIKLAGGKAKWAGGGITTRSKTASGLVDKGRKKYQTMIGHISPTERVRNEAGAEKKKQENLDDYKKKMNITDRYMKEANPKDVDNKGNMNMMIVQLQQAMARKELGDKDENGELVWGKMFKDVENNISARDRDELVEKNLEFSTMTAKGRNDVNELEGKTNEKTGEQYTPDEAKEAVMTKHFDELNDDGKVRKLQDWSNPATTKIANERLDSGQMKSIMDSLPKNLKGNMATGNMLNVKEIDRDTGDIYSRKLDNDGKIVRGNRFVEKATTTTADYDREEKKVESDNEKYSLNSVKLGKGLEESFKQAGDTAEETTERIENSFGKLEALDIAKLPEKDQLKYSYNANEQQLSSLGRKDEPKAMNNIQKSKEEYKKEMIKNAKLEVTEIEDENGKKTQFYDEQNVAVGQEKIGDALRELVQTQKDLKNELGKATPDQSIVDGLKKSIEDQTNKLSDDKNVDMSNTQIKSAGNPANITGANARKKLEESKTELVSKNKESERNGKKIKLSESTVAGARKDFEESQAELAKESKKKEGERDDGKIKALESTVAGARKEFEKSQTELKNKKEDGKRNNEKIELLTSTIANLEFNLKDILEVENEIKHLENRIKGEKK